MLVGFGGYARSGKDTAVSTLVSQRGFEAAAFADALRAMASAINPFVEGGRRYNDVLTELGYDVAKEMYPEVRRFLQTLGTEGCRATFGETCLIDVTLEKMLPGVNYALSDVRFPNELEAILAAQGLTVWIAREGIGPVNGHVTDNALGPDDFDVVIDNNGSFEDLTKRVLRTVDMFLA